VAAVSLAPSDLTLFVDNLSEEQAEVMIADVTARAARVAPCIIDTDFEYAEAAKAILRAVLLRWAEQGNAALTSRSVTKGPFAESETYDSRQQRRGAFWPSEIEDLQELCRGESDSSGEAFGVDTHASTTGTLVHADVCALFFGALYCSCGAVLTYNLPLYEWDY
jgi:hypothetical protein